MDARKKNVLLAVVEAYIQTGEPVGSKMISQLPQIHVSAATVRNDMAVLEELGYLDQPHTSAGRVPTYSGYRLYPDEVLERIAFIKQAQLLGFSLDEIRQLISQKKKGESPCLEARDIIRRRLDELNEKIDQLVKHRDEVTEALKEWDQKERVDGHVCGLIEESHIETGPGKKKI